jgi:hypothetical protein
MPVSGNVVSYLVAKVLKEIRGAEVTRKITAVF